MGLMGVEIHRRSVHRILFQENKETFKLNVDII